MANSNERELELLTLRKLMQTDNGRTFVWRLLKQTGILVNDFDKDPAMNAFYSGQREVGSWLSMELMEAALDEYTKMIKEHPNGW